MRNAKSPGIILGLLILISALDPGPGVNALETPYPIDAPWPVMRGNLSNNGQGRFMEWAPSPDAPQKPAHFRTGNGIFSTPVIDGQEYIYVGSADHYFYALDPASGEVVWKFDAHELIDSAAALSRDGRIYVPAGAAIYALDMDGNKIWDFDVTNNRPEGLYTFGTNYWWEGNVVVGPDGHLYAGNNDFFFYSIRTDGTLRWTHRTGFLIWTAPAFGPDTTMYFAGFDMRLYALDRETGAMKWKRNLKNPLVASPALGPDGTIYQGSFDGNLYAINSKNGRVKWKLQTDSHIYGSAAIDNNGRVYVTSTDGFLYAIEGQTGDVAWTYYTGDAVRSSPVLGPDPEGKQDYLVYFGGGQGNVFAIDPAGNRRWSFNTLTLAEGVDYPNINASPALGKHGIAAANANGDVFYIPYDYYLKGSAQGITLDPTEGYREEGAFWHWVSAGGVIEKESVDSSAGGVRSIHPAQVTVLRLIVRDRGRIVRARLDPGTVRAEVSPAFDYSIEVIGDDRTITIIPEEMLEPGREYRVKISAGYETRDGGSGNVDGELKLRVAGINGQSPFLNNAHPGYVLTHMALPQPPIIPSLDQIGIAIMRIPFTIVETDPQNNTFVAWAVQKYGESAGGEEQGIPDSRSLFYSFGGKVEGDFFVLESKNCFFEESSFPFPLDVFRLSGRINRDGTVEKGASIFAKLDPPSILKALTMLSVSSEEEASGRQSWFGNSMSGGGAKGFTKAALVTLPTAIGYITNHIWGPWDIYNHEGNFVTTGTFRMEPLPARMAARPRGMRVRKFEYDKKGGKVIAEVEVTDHEARLVMVGILLVDKRTGEPVPVNYNLEMSRQRLEDGTKRTVIKIPGEKLHSGELRAYLMADLAVLEKLEL